VQGATGDYDWVTGREPSADTIALLALTVLATWLTWLALAVLPQTRPSAIRRRA